MIQLISINYSSDIMNKYPKRSDSSLNFDTYSKMSRDVNTLNNTQFDPTVFTVIKDGTGTFVTMTPGDTTSVIPTDFTIHKIEGNKVYVYGGTIIIGDAETEVNETLITITEEVNIIGTEYSYAGGTFIIKNFGATFNTDTMHIRRKLFTVSYIDSTLSIVRVHNPQIYPANWGNQDA